MVAVEQNDILELCKNHLGEYRIRNGQIVAKFCPFCNGGNSGDTETFSVGLYNGAFSCLRGGCSKTGSFRELCEFFGERPAKMVSMPSSRSKRLYARPNITMQPVTEEIISYFAQRNISQKTIEAFGIGSDSYGNIVFPFYRDGELVYVNTESRRSTKKATVLRNGQSAIQSRYCSVWTMQLLISRCLSPKAKLTRCLCMKLA